MIGLSPSISEPDSCLLQRLAMQRAAVRGEKERNHELRPRTAGFLMIVFQRESFGITFGLIDRSAYTTSANESSRPHGRPTSAATLFASNSASCRILNNAVLGSSNTYFSANAAA